MKSRQRESISQCVFSSILFGLVFNISSSLHCFSQEPSASSHFHESSCILPSRGVTPLLLAIHHHWCKLLQNILVLVLVLVLDLGLVLNGIFVVVLSHPSAVLLQPNMLLHLSKTSYMYPAPERGENWIPCIHTKPVTQLQVQMTANDSPEFIDPKSIYLTQTEFTH